MKKKLTKKSHRCHEEHPNHTGELPKLNRVEGQMGGIKKMIGERRYCPEIIQQMRAVRNALFNIESSLIEAHLNHCVSTAFQHGNDQEKKKKIAEVMQLFKKADSGGIKLE